MNELVVVIKVYINNSRTILATEVIKATWWQKRLTQVKLARSRTIEFHPALWWHNLALPNTPHLIWNNHCCSLRESSAHMLIIRSKTRDQRTKTFNDEVGTKLCSQIKFSYDITWSAHTRTPNRDSLIEITVFEKLELRVLLLPQKRQFSDLLVANPRWV